MVKVACKACTACKGRKACLRPTFILKAEKIAKRKDAQAKPAADGFEKLDCMCIEMRGFAAEASKDEIDENTENRLDGILSILDETRRLLLDAKTRCQSRTNDRRNAEDIS